MKRMWRFVGALVLASGLTACEPIEFDDGGGGGGGGNVLFTRGFAFVREADRNVYVVDDQGDANSPQRLTTSGGTSHPSVSRSGRSVVYVQQTGTTFELRTVPTDASANPSTVFASSGTQCARCTNFRFPTFNSAGSVIVFSFNRGSGTNFALGRVNADGSGFQELTTGQPAVSFGAPSFFPDGQSVLSPAGSSSSQLNQLARVSLTGNVSFITNNVGSGGGEVQVVVNRAVVSPDGTQVALDGRVSSGGTRIFVGSLSPFGPLARVTDHPGEPGAQDSFPSWVNATQVGFLSNAGGSQNIYRVSLTSAVGPGTLLIPSAAEPAYGGT
jgi:TolB protein